MTEPYFEDHVYKQIEIGDNVRVVNPNAFLHSDRPKEGQILTVRAFDAENDPMFEELSAGPNMKFRERRSGPGIEKVENVNETSPPSGLSPQYMAELSDTFDTKHREITSPVNNIETLMDDFRTPTEQIRAAAEKAEEKIQDALDEFEEETGADISYCGVEIPLGRTDLDEISVDVGFEVRK